MSLRTKILLVIAALMGILYILAAGALIPELAERGLRRDKDLARSAAQAVASTLSPLTPDERLKLLADDPFKDLDFSKWAMLDESGKIVAWNLPGTPGLTVTRDSLRGMGLTITCDIVPSRPADPVWRLMVAPVGSAFSMDRELWSLAITMLIGTLMMGAGVYMLVFRLMIRPVERLEQASRSAATLRGTLVKVPHTARNDEIGALMRSYNTMAGEVNDLRMNLEKKVRESVAALEKTQQNLILAERLSVAGKMAAGVAHEINNPLGGMLNAARSLQSKATPGTRESDYLALILDGLGRIQHIVSTMKQFGRPTGEQADVDVKDVLDGSLLFVQHRMKELGIELRREVPEAPPGTFAIRGYRAALGQVFLNLMVNALDALDAVGKSADAKPRNKCLTVQLIRERDWIVASIQDNGIGMPKDVQERAGEMFYTTKPETHGTGLGLAIVKHILQEHGGMLEIESTLGMGTTMHVKLPLPAKSKT